MRAFALVLLALLAPLLAPPAQAGGGSALEIVGPGAPVQVDGATSVQLTARATLADVVCGRDTDLHVRLRAYGPSGTQAFVPDEVVMHVPAGGYMAQPYVGEAPVQLQIAAPSGMTGHVMVAGAFDVPDGCVGAGDGSAQTQADVAFSSQASGAAEPAPSEASPAPGASPPGESSSPTSQPDNLRPITLQEKHSLLPWALGVGLVVLVGFILGRLGKGGQVGGRDELP